MTYQTRPTNDTRLAVAAHEAREALQNFWTLYFEAAGEGRNTYQFQTTLKVFQAVNSALANVGRGQAERQAA
jgi:hypothetical protein